MEGGAGADGVGRITRPEYGVAAGATVAAGTARGAAVAAGAMVAIGTARGTAVANGAVVGAGTARGAVVANGAAVGAGAVRGAVVAAGGGVGAGAVRGTAVDDGATAAPGTDLITSFRPTASVSAGLGTSVNRVVAARTVFDVAATAGRAVLPDRLATSVVASRSGVAAGALVRALTTSVATIAVISCSLNPPPPHAIRAANIPASTQSRILDRLP
jgi:hypothetical protein